MAKRRKKSKSSCPDPINTFIDLCGGAATALITRSMLKRDIEKGEGDESLAAATLVFGSRALRKGDAIGIGGMIGINSALKSAQRQPMSTDSTHAIEREVMSLSPIAKSSQEPPRYIWRKFCADGSRFGVYPEDYETADEYDEALNRAKGVAQPELILIDSPLEQVFPEDCKTNNKYVWRKHCTDGSPYGIAPEDFETADDYEDMIQQVKQAQCENSKTE